MRVRSAIVRPWMKAGLSVLLVESAQRAAELRGTEEKIPEAAAAALGADSAHAFRTPAQAGGMRQAVPQAERRMPAGRGAPSTAALGSGERFPKSARPAGTSPSAPAVPPASVQQSAERATSAADSVRTSAASSANAGILATPGARPVQEWPASWLALKNRRPLPPRPLVLWTYAGLGEDLTGTPDEVRRRVIVRMLMELHHPGGTHVFWPCGLAGEKPEDGPALFWSGVRLLNPRVLLLFGSEARDTLAMPRTLGPFCQERVNGRLVIQLPKPQSLAADEASFKRALAFLSQLLRFCTRRQA